MPYEIDPSAFSQTDIETAIHIDMLGDYLVTTLLNACGIVRYLDIIAACSELPWRLKNRKKVKRAIIKEARAYLLGCERFPCGCATCEDFEIICERAGLDWKWCRELFRKVAAKGWRIHRSKLEQKKRRAKKCEQLISAGQPSTAQL